MNILMKGWTLKTVTYSIRTSCLQQSFIRNAFTSGSSQLWQRPSPTGLRSIFWPKFRCTKIKKTDSNWSHCQGFIGVTLLGLGKGAQKFVVHCKSASHSSHSRVLNIPVPLKGKEPKFNWYKFWLMLKPHLMYFCSAIVFAMVVAILNIQIPQMLGEVVNIVAQYINSDVRPNFLESIKKPALQLINMYTAQALFTFLYIYSLSCAGERVAAEMRKQLFHNILYQDIAFFDKQRTGELVSRMTADVQDFKSSFKQCVSQGLRSVTQIIGCVISLYAISPTMTTAMLTVIPIVVVTGTALGSVLRKLSNRVQMQVAKATTVGEEAISNIRTVRAFGMEDMEIKMYANEVDESCRLSEQLGFGIGFFQGGANLFLNGIVLGSLYLGGQLVSAQNMTPGELMSFLAASQVIQRSLGQVFLLFGQFVRGIGAGARVFEYIDATPNIPLHGGHTIPSDLLKGYIEFEDVTFAYPTRPEQDVLKKFSLQVPPGKMVAIVGESGSGKSTLAALLERFYDIDTGRITVDGVNVKDLDPSWLRGKAIGFINQEPILFATSIMENIRYGRPDASDKEVMDVAAHANAHDFITSFPHGYNTVVGEKGVTISGGQKQRIAIARALLKNPSVLILDEATSALDVESERIVQAALDKNITGKTVLVIAHRLSTIQNADLIAVVHNGSIVEMGTHEQLKASQGIYWNLIQQQEKEEMISNHIRPDSS